MKLTDPLQRFLSILFKPGEYARVGNDYRQRSDDVVPVGKVPSVAKALRSTTTGTFCTLNPIVWQENHGSCAVNGPWVCRFTEVILRNILVEIDDSSMSLDVQQRFFDLHGIPWSTRVWSGGKSLHLIIALDVPFESLHQYRQYCYAIYRALSKMTDPNPSYKATTKLPGFRREHRYEPRYEKQELVGLNRKITRLELDSWLIKMGSFHWTTRPPKEFDGTYTMPAKLQRYVDAQEQSTKYSSGEFVTVPCPVCNGQKMWFGIESGKVGCHTCKCSRQQILDSINERDYF